jgi:hypothetical protein
MRHHVGVIDLLLDIPGGDPKRIHAFLQSLIPRRARAR